MEDTSYIKLFRKILKSPIWDNEKMLKVWIWCLLKATHKDREQLVGRQMVLLKKGQFIFGRKKASEELKIKEKTLYDYMQILQDLQMLNIKSNNKFSVVTIEKWEDYQIEELKFDNKPTTNEQQMNTNKNVKNIYLYLFNKYREQIKEARFSQRIKILSEIKQSKEYGQLDSEEKQKIYNELMAMK